MTAVASTIATLGALLLLGLVTDSLARRTPLPRVTLLMLLGLLAGPVGFDLLPAARTVWFEASANVALAMIGFLLGGEFTYSHLKRLEAVVFKLALFESVVTAAVVGTGFLALGAGPELALSLAGIAAATAPAATLAVVRESQARGRFVDVLKGVVAVDDVMAIVLFSLLVAVTGVTTAGVAPFHVLLDALVEIGGSAALGLALGVPAAYLTGRLRAGEATLEEALGLVLLCGGLALGLGLSPILAAMVMGAAVANLARHHQRPFHEIESIEWPFLVLFFILAGAALEIEVLGAAGAAAAAYVGLRATGKLLGATLGGRLAAGSFAFGGWLGLALLPQAGVALGLALAARMRFPEVGSRILDLVIVGTVVFELAGPVATRLSLRRAGAVGGPDGGILRTLRPAAFRRLPAELRARHVGGLARDLPRGLRDPGFAELLERIDGGPLASGCRARPFFDGDEAASAMLEAIAAARHEVLVETYIFTDDATGRRFLEALAAAAGRGARVAVLADAWGSHETGGGFWREMRRRGVEVRLFHPLLPAFLWYQFRDHRKILVADRRIAFVGGMNVADEYASSRRRQREVPRAMRDTHLRVEGPVAGELAAVFAEGWQRAGGELPVELPAAAAAGPEGDGVPLLVVDSRPGRGSQETASTLAAVLAAARRSVWLTVGYFAPGRQVVTLLTRAAGRGCDVRLLLPGPTDVPLVRHAGHAAFGRLLAGGVRIWEYQPAVLHAKSLVADGYLSIIGSANLDVRSWRLNAECGLVALDEGLAESLAEAFLGDLAASTEIDLAAWRRRRPGHRLGDHLAGWLTPLL